MTTETGTSTEAQRPKNGNGAIKEEWQSFLRPLEHVHNFIAICKNEQFLYLNPIGCEMLGFANLDEAIGVAVADIIHKDYSDIAELGLSLFAEEDAVVSLKFVRSDGDEVDVEIWVSEMDMAGDTVYLVEAKNITGHLRAARALRAREQRLAGVLNTVADGVLTLAENGDIETMNPAAESMFVVKAKDTVGQNIRRLIPPVDDDGSDTDVQVLDWGTESSFRHEAMGRKNDGRNFPIEIAVRKLEQAEQTSYTAIIRDITAQKKAEAEIYHLAHHDTLTGLPNRHLFSDRLDESLKRAHRHETEVAVMFIDLNKFKPINDNLGHDAGDEALRVVASRLQQCLRGTDTVARIGGDEFVAILEDLDSGGKAEFVARKIIKALEEPMVLAGQKTVLGAAIGIALFPDDARDVAELLHFADQAMYFVKESRNLEFAFYSETPEAQQKNAKAS